MSALPRFVGALMRVVAARFARRVVFHGALGVTMLFSALSLPSAAERPASSIPTARIFFVAGDVAFASPSRGWPEAAIERGMAVRVWRGGSSNRRIVADGTLFRVRPQHVAITLYPGSGVREGDLVTAVGGVAEDVIAEVPAASGSEEAPANGSGTGPALPRSDGLRLLVFNIIAAPRVVAAGFDTHFLEALRHGGAPSADPAEAAQARSAGVVIPAPVRRQSVPGPSEIRLQAARNDADLVLVPVYISSGRADSVEVRVFDGRTGAPAGVTSSPIRPIPSLVWTSSGRRAGRLELVGRWSGLRPAPDAAALRRDGAVIAHVGADLFTLHDAEAALCRDDVNVSARRRVPIGPRGSLMAVVEPIPFEEAAEAGIVGGDRVVIYDGDEPIFRSGSFGAITGLVSRSDLLLVLAGDAIELLRLH